MSEPLDREFQRLRERLELTNLRITRLYLLGKARRGPDDAEDLDPLDRLYVSDLEFQGHLAALSGLEASTLEEPDVARALAAIDEALAVRSRREEALDRVARQNGETTRFDALLTRCGLDALDREILLLALAPEVDRRYRRVYAYLHDDFTRGLPSVGLVVDALAPMLGGDRLAILSRFEARSPLLRRGLVELMEARSDDMKPLAQRHMRVSDAAAGWLLGVPRIADAVADKATFRAIPPLPPNHVLPPDAHAEVGAIAELVENSSRPVTVFLSGKEAMGCRACADLLAHRVGLPVVQLDLQACLGAGDAALKIVDRVLGDAYLFGAAVETIGFPDVATEDPPTLRRLEVLWRRLQKHHGHLLVPLREPPPAAWQSEERHSVGFRVLPPDFADRIRVLEELLADEVADDTLDREAISVIANRYKLGRDKLMQAVAHARDRAWARARATESTPVISLEDLVEGARAQFARDIGALARRIEPRFGFVDLVLPRREKAHLEELVAYVDKRGQVYENWGFETTFSRGTGAKALFFGRSGTGKTMAAECVAKRLGLDLFKVDLSSVVSKWVGETEKNLGAIFDRAEEAQAVLLFDEADSLFGQRTGVNNAVDRYANLETNYLLQRVEEYDGIAILSSNFKQNIDEAFIRRFHFVVEFPFPDQDSREEIWTRAFPVVAPLADDVDFTFLAKRFKFTGGNIKNSVLRAAFLAARESHEISMRHVLWGVLREYQNLEREPTERDFGKWWGELRGLVAEARGKRRSG